MASAEEIEKKLGVRVATNELGRTGLKHFGGVLYEEFLTSLQGEKGQAIYKEMSENSPVIGAMLFAVESLLRSVDWDVEPASLEPADLEAAEFLEQCRDDMSHTFEDFISEILSMLRYGWSYFETVYKRRTGPDGRGARSKYDDNRIGWRKFSIRAQETLYRWEIDDNGGIKGMWQYPIPVTPGSIRSADVIFLPIEKCLHFRTTSAKNSPEGRSILRNSYRPWFFAKRIEEIEAIGVERDLAGMPIARIPIEFLNEARTENQEQTYNYIKTVVQKTKRDEQEGIIFPKVLDENGNDLFEFDLLSTGARRSFDTGAIVQRYMQQSAMTIMADFILLGHENVGSFALSSDKTELFAVALGAWLDAIEHTLNRHAVPRLFELNDFAIEEYPQFRHGDLEKPDIQQLGAFITSLAQAGAPIFPDVELENTLRDMADLPPVDPEERERMMQQQSQAGFFGPGGGPGGAEAGAEDPNAPPTDNVIPMQQPQQKKKPTVQGETVAKSIITPQYFDGTRWKSIRSRHRFLKELTERVGADDSGD